MFKDRKRGRGSTGDGTWAVVSSSEAEFLFVSSKFQAGFAVGTKAESAGG